MSKNEVKTVNGNVEVVSTLAVELQEAVTGMFDSIDTSKLPQEVNEKTQASQGYMEFTGVNADGEEVPVRIYDVTLMEDVQVIRSASKAGNVVSLMTAARLARMVNRGAYKTFGVNNPDKLNEILHLGIGKENARKWLKVGQLFLDIKEDGTPIYREIDGQQVPHLPVSTLVFMTKLVTKDEETGEYDYSKFFEFVRNNNITSLSSQSTVRGLLTTKKTPEEKDDNEENKDTDGTEIAQGSTRAMDLARSMKGMDWIIAYATKFKASNEVKKALDTVTKYLEAQEKQRAEDTSVQGPKADAWVIPYEA